MSHQTTPGGILRGALILALWLPLQVSTAEDTIKTTEFIVKAPDAQALERFVENNGLRLGPLVTYPNPSQEVLRIFGCYYIVAFPDLLKSVQASLVEELMLLQGVEYVEPNEIIQLEPEIEGNFLQNPFHMPDSFSLPHTPNDPLYSEQWNMVITETDWAWNVSTGEGVTIAIIDDGVDSDHEDLIDNLDMEHAYNLFYNNKDVKDLTGHGTSVSGCAAAKIDNNKGITGVAGNAKIMPLRIRNDQGQTSWSVINNAILYAADNGARVISLSQGNNTGNSTTEITINYAWSTGCFLCASAGNENTDKPHYPAAYANIMSVGASNMQDGRVPFSNYGQYVDIYAPGVAIYRTTNDGRYSTTTGTSIACPQIAGLAALIRSANPRYTNKNVWGKIIDSADTITIDKGKVLRMNSRKALDVEKIEGVAEQGIKQEFQIISPMGSKIVFRYLNYPKGFYAEVFDAAGRKVDEIKTNGSFGTITWGEGMSQGVYLIKLADSRATVKVVLVR